MLVPSLGASVNMRRRLYDDAREFLFFFFFLFPYFPDFVKKRDPLSHSHNLPPFHVGRNSPMLVRNPLLCKLR